MVGSNSNIFGQKSIVFWEHGGAPVRQKLGMILENKVVQKSGVRKNVFFTKNGFLN